MNSCSAIAGSRAFRLPSVHPHVLKHSRGSHLLEETDKIHVVQDALGHKNIANTMIYARFSCVGAPLCNRIAFSL